MATTEKAVRIAKQVAKVSRDWMEVVLISIFPVLFQPQTSVIFKCFSDNNLGGCSTYLPSSTESVVSGRSPGSAASITAGKDTRITR